MRRACILAATTLAILALWANSASAQEVRRVTWGFSGNVVPHRFNLLRLVLHNPDQEPLRKTLRLSPVVGGLDRGAPLFKEVYLGPGVTKTIEMYPFITSTIDAFRVTWVEGGLPHKFNAAAPAAPQIVFLERPSLGSRRRVRLDAFPPELLPTKPEGMDCLRGLVIDRVPDLSKAQRLALIAWLRRGGEVHILLRGPSHPKFKRELDILNIEGSSVRFGQGRIFRHFFTRSALNKEIPPEIDPRVPGTTSGMMPPTTGLRQGLQTEVQLRYSWGLIFFLTVVYVALIGPVFYLLSTRRLNWWSSLLVLTGVVAASTWVFAFVGARSSLETSGIRTWSLATPAGDGTYNVTRFSSVFVVTGGNYTFGGENYGFSSSGQRLERVNGEIRNGQKPTYRVDMPGMSSRLIVQQATLDGPKISFECNGATLKTDHPLHEVISVHQKWFYRWTRQRGVWMRGVRRKLSSIQDQNWPLLETAVREFADLRFLDTSEPATHLDQHIVFCEGPLIESFKLTGTGPRGPVTNETGTTVFRLQVTSK